MKILVSGLGAAFLIAASHGGAVAQGMKTVTETSTTTTEVVSEPRTTTTTTVYQATPNPIVLGPQIQTASRPLDAPQAAPFNPAPRGTAIDTTVDSRIVQMVNGYDVIVVINGKWDQSRGLFTDGYNGAKFFPPQAVDSFWPLEVGKTATFNVDGDGGVRKVTMQVLRTETTRVPAGNFYTYVVERRERPMDGGSENVATYWYAPAVGTSVKFEERLARVGRARPSYEAVAIVLPHALDGSVTPIDTPPGDSAENREAFCRERNSTVSLPDGRGLKLPCITLVQTELAQYRTWLVAHGHTASTQ